MKFGLSIAISLILFTALFFRIGDLTLGAQTDDGIVAAVNESYTFKHYLQDTNIKVESKDGLVTLTGTVPDEYHELLAKDTVINLPGVTGVRDRLEIAEDESPGHPDRWLTVKVKAMLLFHRSTSGFATTVDTHDGVVNVGGSAKSTAEIDLVTELVKDIKGVKEVVNNMTVE